MDPPIRATGRHDPTYDANRPPQTPESRRLPGNARFAVSLCGWNRLDPWGRLGKPPQTFAENGLATCQAKQYLPGKPVDWQSSWR